MISMLPLLVLAGGAVATAAPTTTYDWSPALAEFYSVVDKHIQEARAAPNFPQAPACDLTQATMPVAPTPLPAPNVGDILGHVAIGRGVQVRSSPASIPHHILTQSIELHLRQLLRNPRLNRRHRLPLQRLLHRRLLPRPPLPPPQPRPQLPPTLRRRLHAALQHGPLRPPLLRQPHHPNVRHDRRPSLEPRRRYCKESRQLHRPCWLAVGRQRCGQWRRAVVVSSIDECYDGEGSDGIQAQYGGWVAAKDVR